MTPARLIAALALSAGAFLAVSCRDAVGEGTDALALLCESLEACYGDTYDCDAIRRRFGRSQSDDQGFLAAFDDGCAGDGELGCAGTRLCLDRSPVCAREGQVCGATVDCCDSTLGRLRCRGVPSGTQVVPVDDSPSPGICCKADGATCTEGDSPDGCCSRCIGGTCGGVQCVEQGDACSSSLECCSRFCEGVTATSPGRCEARGCAFAGEACATAQACCPPQGEAAAAGLTVDCVDGACVYLGGGLGLAGADCTDDAECASGYCVSIFGRATGRCAGDSSCLPLGADCAVDIECCQGEGFEPTAPPGSSSLVCSGPNFRCAPNPSCQASGGCCRVQGAPCSSDAQCCTDHCGPAGACAPPRPEGCTAPWECHSLCTTGAPMTAQPPGDPPVGASCFGRPRADCVAEVTQLDPYCECQAWDELCVFYARTVCDLAPSEVCAL